MKKTIINPLAGIATAIFLLSGCIDQSLQELEETKPQGMLFTQALAEGYRKLATVEYTKNDDTQAMNYFADKGLKASEGIIVEPEQPVEWKNIPYNESLKLASARDKLLDLFSQGAREKAPEVAAAAQIHFDCWVAEEEIHSTESRVCRTGFLEAVANIENRMGLNQPHEKEIEVKDHPPFVIYFDLNKATIGAEGLTTVHKASEAYLQDPDHQIVEILAYTDRIGNPNYNVKLSNRRAEAAKRACIKAGIPTSKISIQGMGPLGDTRNPEQRRVEILVRHKDTVSTH